MHRDMGCTGTQRCRKLGRAPLPDLLPERFGDGLCAGRVVGVPPLTKQVGELVGPLAVIDPDVGVVTVGGVSGPEKKT